MIRTYGGPFGQWINNPPPATTRVFSNEFLQSYYSKFNLKCQAKIAGEIRTHMQLSLGEQKSPALKSVRRPRHIQKISIIPIAKTVIQRFPKRLPRLSSAFSKNCLERLCVYVSDAFPYRFSRFKIGFGKESQKYSKKYSQYYSRSFRLYLSGILIIGIWFLPRFLKGFQRTSQQFEDNKLLRVCQGLTSKDL